MNKKELKKLIKPMVKECINEVLLQEGILSSIISEVMIGTQGAVLQEQPKREPKTPTRRYETDDEAMQRLQERKSRSADHKKNLLEAIGTDTFGGVDLFEGTQPLNNKGTPGKEQHAQGALSGYASDDSGVNIDSLLNIAGGSWKKIK